jgi:DNA-binding transcriptional regulator YdaS (Cro superfamily)
MDLKTFLAPLTSEQRKAFAAKCGANHGSFQNVASGFRPCSTALAVAIERESDHAVMRWDLRGDWFLHWPELLGHPKAPKIPKRFLPALTSK